MFFYYLNYTAKTRKSNVSGHKPELNKLILVSIYNFICQKKPISFPIFSCFYIFMATVNYQSAVSE